jgi:hypothetical protein
MSDEERDERDEHDPPREGESEHEWIQRQTSPELRWLDLFDRLVVRVVTNEKRFEAFEEESRRRDERIESKIEFIVNQQAQFATDLQKFREDQEERWKRQEERWEKADGRWARTEESIRGLLAISEFHREEITALTEAQARTGRQLAETGERVDALVNTVERLISERRNGAVGGPEGREG